MTVTMTPWTEEEKDLIRQHYPRTGTRDLKTLLPHRQPNGIRNMASKLGCQFAPRKRNRLAKDFTPEQDALIRRHYPGIRMRTNPMTVETLAKKVGATTYQIRHQALRLGLIAMRKKQPDWTTEEDNFLEEHVHRSVRWIREALLRMGYRRTESGISNRRKRLDLRIVGNGSAYSANELGRMIGKSSRVVVKWIANGLLAAKPRTASVDPIHGGVGDRWEIKPKAVREFIRKYPAHFDLGAVDKYWFLSVVFDDCPR